MREEVAEGWRRLHSEELHNLYVSHSIIRPIKSRMMRWAGNAGHIREKRGIYTEYWSENLRGRDNSEDLGVGGMIILE
jgi:hypothetical protein